MGAQVDLPSSTRYVEGSLRFSRYTSVHSLHVAFNSPMRYDARLCMNVSEQETATIIDDSRCGMSDMFRTAPPTGGLSCFNSWQYAATITIASTPECG